MRLLFAIAVIISAVPASPAQAQIPWPLMEEARDFPSWLQDRDDALGLAIYEISDPTFAVAMTLLDRSSYPVMYGAPVAGLALALTLGDRSDMRAVYRLAVTEGLAYVGQRGFKRAFGRARPFYSNPEIPPKSIRFPDPSDIFSFPSGHAAGTFAIAASLTLSYPYWYVITPGMLWASGVSLSRVWLGVHYTSDVLVGALMGSGIAAAVHALHDYLTPRFLGDPVAPGTDAPGMQFFRLSLSF